MARRKASKTDWREVEYKECSEDWRNRDRLIWATLPVAATVGAVTVGVAYGQSLDDNLGVRFWILLIGVFLTITMLISLMKHRFFQEGSEQQIRSLLNIKDWYSSPRRHRPCDFTLRDIILSEKIDAALTSWARRRMGFTWDIKPSKKIDSVLTGCARRRSGFKWILRGTLVVMAILMGLAAFTVFQLIFN